ncbi:DUF2892 domain-containing protein [Natribaculum luteum]|uniref:DUF2892 domain-containing protein n=1 Tax=Natribaculum luteum TaxID=1586232 RepID=A0ABD5P3Y8_9EURY|nr:DUF2892 domain-containing protein [Natribaculum luteum]
MEPNVGGFDRTVRIALGLAFLSIALAAVASGSTLGESTRTVLVAGTSLVAAVLLASAILQRCPVNRLLGIDTCETARR